MRNIAGRSVMHEAPSLHLVLTATVFKRQMPAFAGTERMAIPAQAHIDCYTLILRACCSSWGYGGTIVESSAKRMSASWEDPPSQLPTAHQTLPIAHCLLVAGCCPLMKSGGVSAQLHR